MGSWAGSSPQGGGRGAISRNNQASVEGGNSLSLHHIRVCGARGMPGGRAGARGQESPEFPACYLKPGKVGRSTLQAGYVKGREQSGSKQPRQEQQEELGEMRDLVCIHT